MFHFGKAAFDERQRAAFCSHKRMPFGYGIGIAVEGKDLRTMVHLAQLKPPPPKVPFDLRSPRAMASADHTSSRKTGIWGAAGGTWHLPGWDSWGFSPTPPERIRPPAS